MGYVLTHGQVRTRATKTTIPPIHVVNVGTNTDGRTQVHLHTLLGLPLGMIPECNDPFRNFYRHSLQGQPQGCPRGSLVHYSLLMAYSRRPNTYSIPGLYPNHIMGSQQGRRTMS